MEETNTTLQWLGPLVAILFFAGIAALVVVLVLLQHRRSHRRAALLASLGFASIQPGPELIRRLESFYRHSPAQRFRFPSLFLKQAPQADFYIFDLVETSGDENTWFAAGSIAVVSPDLRLPRMHLSARLALQGKVGEWMAGMAEKVIGWVATRLGMSRVDLSEHPESDERLLVMAWDQTAAQEFLTRERLGRLLWLADMQRLVDLDCDGDGFIIKRTTPGAKSDPDADLRALLDDARRALTALS